MSLMKTLTIDGQTYDLSMKNLLDGSAVNSLHTPSTSVSSRGQIVLGEYNIPDLSGNNLSRGDYSLLIGNGTSTSPSNALSVDWNGNIMTKGMAGVIQMFGGETPPPGWLICDGSAVSRTTYATLFAVVGTTYGAGDGSTTFNIPDLQGRFPVGVGGNYNVGSTGGSEDSIVPYHNHHVDAISSGAQQVTLTGSAKALGWSTATASGIISIASSTNDRTASSGKNFGHRTYNINASHAHTVSAHDTNYAGTSGEEVGGNMPPYLGINFIIATGKTN